MPLSHPVILSPVGCHSFPFYPYREARQQDVGGFFWILLIAAVLSKHGNLRRPASWHLITFTPPVTRSCFIGYLFRLPQYTVIGGLGVLVQNFSPRLGVAAKLLFVQNLYLPFLELRVFHK